jgi:hypothetical protein
MVDASLPFIHQLRLLVQPSELGGLTYDLGHTDATGHFVGTVPALDQLTKETIPLLRNQVRPASSCVANNIIPWSHLTLNDPHFNASNGFPPHPVYVEGADFLPGLAGESRDFDANGYFIRILGALGNTGVTSLQSGLIGGTLAPIAGEEPQVPPTGEQPPTFAPTSPCENQPRVTDLSATASPAPSQFSPTGLLPPSVVSLLQNPPIPLPKILAKALAARRGKKATPLTPAQRSADLQQIAKYGLWERFPNGTPPASAPRSSGQAKASGAR